MVPLAKRETKRELLKVPTVDSHLVSLVVLRVVSGERTYEHNKGPKRKPSDRAWAVERHEA